MKAGIEVETEVEIEENDILTAPPTTPAAPSSPPPVIDQRGARYAIIIGAGPAGLTAAYELLTRSKIIPIILEKGDFIGGIARTIQYKGNRIDIGGHRFFSKSDRVMDWWTKILPIEAQDDESKTIAYQSKTREIETSAAGPNPDETDEVMLVRERKSRIYFLRKFFDYPISLSARTLRNLGLFRGFRIGASYIKSMLFPIRDEQNLEEFFINRFGRELYKTFFRSYTEKVWGLPCHEISAEWGAQRIKGLSILKALKHAAGSLLRPRMTGIQQKEVETSLIERFLYPKHGPGQLWEEVARRIVDMGGQIHLDQDVVSIHRRGGKICAVTARDANSGEERVFSGDVFFSTMPIKELMRAMTPKADDRLLEISDGLMYRDFITVGLLVNQLKVRDDERGRSLIKDNWIYVQEPEVQVGRLQIFNNWSPYMVADPSKVWIGLEYFCNEGDELWTRSDLEMTVLGKSELASIGILEEADVIDATVLRVPKTYPAYFGTYDRLGEVREFLEGYDNLFLVGRNGMHKYNNQDHSMLTAMTAVDNILSGRTDQSNIWAVNTEQEYHEEKAELASRGA
jgi:protoporphyrinogen oxidase